MGEIAATNLHTHAKTTRHDTLESFANDPVRCAIERITLWQTKMVVCYAMRFFGKIYIV